MENLKDFGMEWVLFGLLFFCIMTFAIFFMSNNNSTGLGEFGENYEASQSSVQSNLLGIESQSDSLLNTSAGTNPEAGDLGSADSVTTSYSLTGIARGFITSFKTFLGLILSGAVGQMLLSVFAGLFGLTSLYFITKWIRQGF